MLDMGEQNTCQFLCKHITTEKARRHGRVNWVRTEVHALFFNGSRHRNLVNNILLSSVLDTNVTHSEGHFLVHDHPLGTNTSVHDIELGKDTDSADTLRVELTSHLETIRGGHIGVSGNNTENNSARVRHVSAAHIFSNLFDVLSLVGASQGDTCYTGKINEGQIRTSVGEDLQHDRFVDDSLGLTTDLVGQSFDGLSHLVEVTELLSLDFFREYSPGLLIIMQVS